MSCSSSLLPDLLSNHFYLKHHICHSRVFSFLFFFFFGFGAASTILSLRAPLFFQIPQECWFDSSPAHPNDPSGLSHLRDWCLWGSVSSYDWSFSNNPLLRAWSETPLTGQTICASSILSTRHLDARISLTGDSTGSHAEKQSPLMVEAKQTRKAVAKKLINCLLEDRCWRQPH